MTKLCRFQNAARQIRIGLAPDDHTLLDLTAAGVESLSSLLENDDLHGQLAIFVQQKLPSLALSEVKLLAPVEEQEIWAAGVTYLRSKKARMEESDFSATAYDRVYEAERPEIFFKSLPSKTVGPDDAVGIRKDSRWNVPEPELALVLNSRGHIVGFTIGNDMSSRDIEGENLLYLPQAKIYDRSCALGPFITIASEAEARSWQIRIEILRANKRVFSGETAVSQIKRAFGQLAEFLFRSQKFPNGAVLLTGTGVVPPDDFSLQPGDTIRIEISDVGVLANSVVEV
ncbi:MAG: fumarylacetoacetate hydrolase family protein [Verrucomicrobia bacterium]|nr:fumarylacetoacetate hydrolase family protein [Verrucomicrobiota bacterium]